MEWRDESRRHGYLKTAGDAAYRIAYRATGLRVFYCFLIPCETLLKKNATPEWERLSLRFLSVDEVLRLLIPEEMTMTPDFVHEAFGKGDRCFGVLDGERLVHYCWFATSPTPVIDGLEFEFPAGGVYLYNGFTSREYRGRNIGPEAMVLGASSYMKEGCSTAVALVAANNFNSLLAVRKMGFERVGGFVFSALLPSKTFRTSGCSRLGLKLRNADDR